MNSAFKCLYLVARQHSIDLNAEQMQHEFSLGDAEAGDAVLVKAARRYGMKAKKVRFRWKNLANMGKAFPAIARLKNGRCVVVTGFQERSEKKDSPEKILIIDPTAATPKVEKVTKEKFATLWDGHMVLVRRDYGLTDEEQPFSASWLISRFLRQKALMFGLVIIAAILHLFAVLPVVFIIIILDKVVSFQAEATLYVVTIGVIIAFIFNAFLGYLRQYIILFATSRVDVRLNAKVFDQLLNLPLSYFQKREAATVQNTVLQTNTIRSILAGKLFATILDSTALLIFIPILFFYNPLLCLIVVFFSGLIALNVIITAKIQKGISGQASGAETQKQSILTNTISGMETIKGLAIEPIQNRAWEEAVYCHTKANFKLGKINAASAQVSGLLQQLMTVALIFIGVQLVFTGELSAGVLIGVNMLGGRVTTPLVQLFTLRMDLNKLRKAITSLEGMLVLRGEVSRKGVSSNITGKIGFKSVSHTYPDGTKSLNSVSLSINARSRVAIVGSAGSGKSTMVRLLQKLINPDSGTITLDGQDIRLLDHGKLRSQVAVVSEDSVLFSGSIRENIAVPYPNASMARIIWATKLVGVHEEIKAMPEGYETKLLVNGSNLTKAQQLKIAMARSIIRNPNIFILDGVFSHFEVEGLLALKHSLKEVALGRTLIVVSKQLAQVSDFGLILVMDNGKLVEWGTHKTLLARNQFYTKLWRKEISIMGIPSPKVSVPAAKKTAVATQQRKSVANPTQQPTKPTQQTTKPAQQPTKPAQQTTTPAQQPALPSTAQQKLQSPPQAAKTEVEEKV
ncbi:MAG: ATP-binding cassette domain-containing protein [Magnetococcales bacterium]|nr:ATP-binding cassette domain-containing protein [Magnetococcales bacterium]